MSEILKAACDEANELCKQSALMSASADMAAGAYGASLWFTMLANMLERQFPGSKDFILQAADLLPWAKLWAAIHTALKLAGTPFLDILTAILSQWLVVTPGEDGGPVRMMAKP